MYHKNMTINCDPMTIIKLDKHESKLKASVSVRTHSRWEND